MPHRALSTGSLRLDIALGIGGIPRGEFIEISGATSSGKTTLCQHIVADAQKSGDVCAWIDVDHSFDPDYALRCGIDAELLYISEPETAEQALGILETLAVSGSMAVLVLDSVTSLISQEEMNIKDALSFQELIDRQLSQTLRRIHNVIHKNRTTILLTDQLNQGIGKVYHQLAQNPRQLALKLQAGIRLKLHSLRPILQNGTSVGNRIQVRVVKNHFAPCFHRTGFDIIYSNGINKAGEIFDLGIQLKIISKQNADFFFGNQKLGSDRSEVIKFFKQKPPIAEEIEQTIRLKI